MSAPALGILDSVIELELPASTPGIGRLISSPDSPDLIADIRVTAFSVQQDDYAFFGEIADQGQGFTDIFPAATSRLSAAYSRPGTIKAFYYRKFQTGYLVPKAGLLQVALVDLRKKSPTFGMKNTLYLGLLRQWQVLIPPGIAHGYKVIGHEPSAVTYLTNRSYDPKDDGRITYNDASIAYDWESIQLKPVDPPQIAP